MRYTLAYAPMIGPFTSRSVNVRQICEDSTSGKVGGQDGHHESQKCLAAQALESSSEKMADWVFSRVKILHSPTVSTLIAG